MAKKGAIEHRLKTGVATKFGFFGLWGSQWKNQNGKCLKEKALTSRKDLIGGSAAVLFPENQSQNLGNLLLLTNFAILDVSNFKCSQQKWRHTRWKCFSNRKILGRYSNRCNPVGSYVKNWVSTLCNLKNKSICAFPSNQISDKWQHKDFWKLKPVD